MDEILGHLRSALNDPSTYIRVGAVNSLYRIAPVGAAEMLLDECAGALKAAAPAEEAAALGAQLARTRSSRAAELAARLLNADQGVILDELNTGDAARWAGYVDTQAKGVGLPDHAKEMLVAYSNAWTGTDYDPVERPRSLSDAERSKSAGNAIDYWRGIYGLDGVPEQSRQKLDDTVKLLNEKEWPRARDNLVKVAITEPNPVVRAIVGHALPKLGLDGSSPLLAAFSKPDAKLFREIYPTFRDRIRARYNSVGPGPISAYLAEEALQQFSDNGTARALTSAALTWAGAPQMRAERVLANMPVEAALPQLTWSALNGGNSIERAAAYDLLGRIVKGDARLNVGPHRYGAGQIVSGGLDWITEIAGGSSARDWTSYPDIAIPVLRGAISAMPREAAPAPAPKSTQEATRIAADLAPGTGGSLLDTMKRSFSWGGLGGKPKLPAVKLTRHPHAEFPANCHLGDSVVLKVRVLPSQADGTLSPFDVPFKENAATVDIIVIPTAVGFTFEEGYRTLKVPRDGPSDTAVFHARAREAGDWVVDVKLILDAVEVCHFAVRSVVSEMPTAGEAVLHPVEHFSESALDRHGRIRAMFTVKMDHDTERLEWSVIEPGATAPRALGHTDLKFTSDEIARWNKTNAEFIAGLVEKDLTDRAGALGQLKADGNELFEQIAPRKFAEELAKLSPGDLIVIESDADWVPWELLAAEPNSDLLGDRFVIVRSPIIKKGDELPPNAPKAVSPTLQEALVIVGNEIEGDDLARQTFGDYAKRAKKPLKQPDWTQLQAAVKGKDIIHFVCHGRGSKLYLDYGKDAGSKLLVKQAHQLGFDPGAVVFANACSSATASPLLSSFQSFGKEFYLAGARPYIGTLGPVPLALAVRFSALFYTHFALEGLSAADAMRLARIDAAKTFPRPVWLLYCLFGNTSVTRRWSADD